MQQYFWKYAERSGVYPEILKELETYTDEQRAEDMASGANLLELAKQEIAKENNYLNLVQSGKLKSEDRIEVLDKIAMLEREGRFDEDVEEDPPSKELKPEDIDYLRKKWSSKIKTKLTYRVARSFMNNIIANKQLIIKDVIGIEHMNALDSGAVITCNHFNAFDSFAIQIAYEKSKQKKKRRLYRVIREGNYTNFPGFYGMLAKLLYISIKFKQRDNEKIFTFDGCCIATWGFHGCLSGTEYVVELPQTKAFEERGIYICSAESCAGVAVFYYDAGQ